MRTLLGYGFLALPNIFIALCPLGILVAVRWRRVGLIIAGIASFSLYAAATPAFSSYLLVFLEAGLSDNPDFSSAQAIVVLSADFRPEPDRLGPQTIERLMFTAEAHKKLRLPVATSGGPISGSNRAVAELMKLALQNYFDV